MRELQNASLAFMTTLGLGGPAARVVDVETEDELASVTVEAQNTRTPFMVLGGGSNVVIDDAGWPGTIMRPSLRGIDAKRSNGLVQVRVGAGETWDDLVAQSVEEGWVGLACLSGIPGWAGAAPVQNIGAYGFEVGEVLDEVRVFDREQAVFSTTDREACRFDYRSSVFRHGSRYVITSLLLTLRSHGHETVRYPELARRLGVAPGETAPPASVRDAVLELRRSKGMIVDDADPESKSAGSFFVNPIVNERQLLEMEQRAKRLGLIDDTSAMPRFESSPGRWKVPAAWLVERSGFRKGTTESGVGISQKHALALVNRGGTTAALLAFERRVRDEVFEKFGVELSREPILVRAPK